MATGRRLVAGENAKIDYINELVLTAKTTDNIELRKESQQALLEMFDPMIHKICGRWSKYFNDEQHTLIQWGVIINEARFWFIQYMMEKYIIDGPATFNKFMNDHLMQRVRYLYECELKYFKKLLLPDPDRNSYNNDSMEDHIHQKYGANAMNGSGVQVSPACDECLQDKASSQISKSLLKYILQALDDDQYFTVKEAAIFKAYVIEGKTHSEIGRQYGVSRTRISQIVGKVRKKVTDLAMERQDYWERNE